jgi:hypothetical protein
MLVVPVSISLVSSSPGKDRPDGPIRGMAHTKGNGGEAMGFEPTNLLTASRLLDDFGN